MIELTRRSVLISSAMVGALPRLSLASLPATITQRVTAILDASAQTSFLQAKVAIDALIGGSFQLPDLRMKKLADAVQQMAGPNPTDRYKLAAIRKTIYESGPWNDNRAFRYDQAGPRGLRVENKLLSTYFRTRLGNCVSMPILFLILAERVGLNVSLATAPLHVFVRYIDPAGKSFNVEATSGGHFAREAWYRETMPISNRAIENGLYMRALTKREGIAVMASTVMDYLLDRRRYQEAVDLADAILAVNPRDVYAMVKKGTALAEILRIDFIEAYPTPAFVPPALRLRYQILAEQNARMFREAEALGWEPAN